jgi:hypothetical protein
MTELNYDFGYVALLCGPSFFHSSPLSFSLGTQCFESCFEVQKLNFFFTFHVFVDNLYLSALEEYVSVILVVICAFCSHVCRLPLVCQLFLSLATLFPVAI